MLKKMHDHLQSVLPDYRSKVIAQRETTSRGRDSCLGLTLNVEKSILDPCLRVLSAFRSAVDVYEFLLDWLHRDLPRVSRVQ